MIIHKMADVNGMFMREHAFTLTKLGTAKEEMENLMKHCNAIQWQCR